LGPSDEAYVKENPRKTARRDYDVLELPVLDRDERGRIREDLLRALYSETCQSRRALLDIRFKLLAVVPSVSFLAIAGLISATGWLAAIHPLLRVGLSMLGFTATLALYFYEMRNSELYDDLGSRARRIEYELGVKTGQFLGRLNPDPCRWWIDHKISVRLIYSVALLGWIGTAIALYFGGFVESPIVHV
jgi:hypothetical protein